MKVYYKGELIFNVDKKESQHVIHTYLKEPINNRTIGNLRNNLDARDYSYLNENLFFWKKNKKGIQSHALIPILKELTYYFEDNSRINFENIIYEIVEDTDGNLYGKEILTNLLFPLYSKRTTEFYFCLNNDYRLECRDISKNDNMARFAYILYTDGVASINDVNKYLEHKNNGYGADEFEEKIKFYYNENVFAKEIVLKEIEPLEKQNEITKLMEEIEYALELIKQFNKNLYYNLLSEYGELNLKENCNNFQHYTGVKKEFSQLLSKIKLSLLVKEENNESIIDFLNSIIEAYFNKIFNDDNKDNINLIDIDNFTDMFLKSKDKYPYSIQRQVLKKISLVYVLFLKLNSDNINLESLENSYFNDNKKTILLNISVLSELGIVNSISLDFNKKYSNEEILNIIKEIEFNKVKDEDIKKLIK